MNVESGDTSRTKDRPNNSRTEGRQRRAAPTVYLGVALNDVRQQLVLNCCYLRLDHAVKVQLTAARERQVFCCVRE